MSGVAISSGGGRAGEPLCEELTGVGHPDRGTVGARDHAARLLVGAQVLAAFSATVWTTDADQNPTAPNVGL